VLSYQAAWEQVPDRLAFYDYLGHNPAKGGLFRTGPMVLGDGIVIGWLGHPSFSLPDGTDVFPRRMPTWYEIQESNPWSRVGCHSSVPILFVHSGQ
jgi:photosystem II CP47 chlorophyll apoprotein